MVRTINLVTDVLIPFILNRKLIEGLAVSEIASFRAEQVMWFLHYGEASVKLGGKEWSSGNLECLLSKQNISAIPSIGVPGGFLGIQALYLILENFWRNTIKHNVSSIMSLLQMGNNLGIHLEISDKSNTPFLIIKLWAQITIEPVEKDPSEEINQILREGIIDREGKLIPKGWGLKEMLVGATYLKGSPIMNANEKGQEILRCYVDKNKCLCHEFEVLKPMELFILTNQQVEPDLKKVLCARGIYIKSEIPQDFIVPTEYFILDPCNRANAATEISGDDPLKPLKCFSRELDINDLKDENKSVELSIRLETAFIQRLIGNAKICFIIHSASSGDPEYKIWKDIDTNSEQLELRSVVFGINNWNQQALMEYINEKLSQNFLIVIFDRHGECKDTIVTRKCNAKIFWEPYGGGTQTAFSLSHTPKEDLQKRLLLYRIASSSFVKVALLDERIQQILETGNAKWQYGQGPEIRPLECLQLMRIFIPCRLGSQSGLEDDQLDLNNPNEGKILKWIRKKRPHILSVHAGILDKMGKKTPQDVITWIAATLKSMDSQVRRIVIHSGRGIPGNVPELKVPFIGYSAIEHHTISRDLKSKYAFVQELFSARGIKR